MLPCINESYLHSLMLLSKAVNVSVKNGDIYFPSSANTRSSF